MRVLSLWQPWASAMALGFKTVETRPWSTGYRGRVAIHSAKRAMRPEEIPVELVRVLGNPAVIRFPLGYIVAVGNLIDCLPTYGKAQTGSFDYTYRSVFEVYPNLRSPLEEALGDYTPGRYGWVFAGLRQLMEPMPYRGSQGLRGLREEDADRVEFLSELRTEAHRKGEDTPDAAR